MVLVWRLLEGLDGYGGGLGVLSRMRAVLQTVVAIIG